MSLSGREVLGRDEALEPNLSRSYEGAAYSEELELLLRPLLSENE